jgi:hypothetical protein
MEPGGGGRANKLKIPLIEWISGILARFPPARAFALPLSCPGGALTVPLCWILCRCIGSVRTHDRSEHSTDLAWCQTADRGNTVLYIVSAILVHLLSSLVKRISYAQ